MYTNVNESTLFEATTDNFLISDVELSASQSLSVLTATKFICDTRLNPTQKMIYQFICSFTGKSGVFFASHEYVYQSLKISRSTWDRACRALHEHGYLYRRKISKHRGGSIRCYSPKQDYKKYLRGLMEKNYFKVAAEVEAYFTQFDVNALIERNKKISAENFKAKMAAQQQVTHRIRCISGDASNNNKACIRLERTTSNNTEGLKTTPAAAAFDGLIKDCRFSPNDREVARSYFALFEDKIMKKNNPAGFLRWAVINGTAQKELDAAKAEQEIKVSAESDVENNKKLAKELKERLRDKEESIQCRLHVKDTAIYFDYLQDGRTRDSYPLGYTEKNFSLILDKLLEKAYDRCRNTR
jgi:hypothetical protein